MVDGASLSPVARQISLNAVVQALMAGGPLSRAELARQSGLSKQTVSEVVRGLEESGWLLLHGVTSGRPGRAAATYELNARAALAAAIDLGGTKLLAAIGDLRGNILAEQEVPTDPRGGTFVIEQIADLVGELLGRAGAVTGGLRVAVLGTPGVLRAENGSLDAAPNIPGFDRIDVADLLSRRLGAPVLVENDVNLGACGEHWRGRGRDVSDFCFIALGTGIGMGIVAGGQLLRGARGAAGEICNLPLGGDPYDPRGFTLGTLESAVGSAAIVRRHAASGGSNAGTVRDVFAASANGDVAAVTTIEETARVLATAIAAVAATLDPELVILGGGIGNRPELVAEVRRWLPRCTPFPPVVEPSELESRATLLGALGTGVQAIQRQFFGIDLRNASGQRPPYGDGW